MTSRAQDVEINRLALQYGRVAVHSGYSDGEVRVTDPRGWRTWLDVNGNPVRTGGPVISDWDGYEED